MDALELLSGDAQAFKEKVWASQVHLHHTDPSDLVRLLSLDDVDQLLTSVAIRTPAVRVVQDAIVLPSSRFTRTASIAGSPLTGLVDGRKVLDLYDGGATVVLQGLHRYWPPLTRLVRELELGLGHPCQANGYLTPPGSQGFARHSDTHDVFVFQTHGRKLWTVDDDEVLLEPGISMYLPTGTPHSARSQEATSLHVTIGINRVTWRQLLAQVATRVLADRAYDEPLPAGLVDDTDQLRERLAGEIVRLAERLRALDPAAVTDQHVATFLTDRTPTLQGGLTDRVLLDSLDQETRLERRTTSACALALDGDRLRVLLGDRELRMPARLTGAMQRVRDSDSLIVAELPGLDPESRLVLARRLVVEGLLRIVP